MNIEEMKAAAAHLFRVHINDLQLAQLATYERELQNWNEHTNLTAISESQGIRTKHFLDSISITPFVREYGAKKVIDVGTGAGFPGIVMKIMNPEIQLTLVESVGKKIHFCEHVVSALALRNVTCVNSRAEEVGQAKSYREQFDLAVARAVAQLPVLVEYLLPLVSLGGKVIAQKGESGPAEAQKAEYAIGVMGGHLRLITQVTLPGVVEERHLILIDKVAATPNRYPRRTGTPLKKPLTSASDE